jgi:cytoplasmic tRNA 2-thiolation protein 2
MNIAPAVSRPDKGSLFVTATFFYIFIQLLRLQFADTERLQHHAWKGTFRYLRLLQRCRGSRIYSRPSPVRVSNYTTKYLFEDKQAISQKLTSHLLLYRNCFIEYANSKTTRGMASYRPNKNTPSHKLLLPLSLGISSSSLLHMLDRLQKRQASGHLGRAGFDVHVLIIDPSTIHPGYTDVQSNVDSVKESFPRHTFTMAPLHSIFEYDATIKDTFRDFGFVDEGFDSDKARLDAFRASISTATARDDIENLLLVRLVVAFAKSNGCDGIVWGDSDSRLAAKTLANVAKGRGASTTWQVCDGASPWGIDFSFPLRELYKFELELYVKQCPELASFVLPDLQTPENPSNRNLSIDGLMNQYVKTQGEKYPGVMANVVRIVNKLQPMASATPEARCSLCSTLVERTALSGANEASTALLCYACLRSRDDILQNAPSS